MINQLWHCLVEEHKHLAALSFAFIAAKCVTLCILNLVNVRTFFNTYVSQYKQPQTPAQHWVDMQEK